MSPPGEGDPGRVSLAIEDIAVTDVEGERVVPGQTILIEGDRIARVGPSSEVEIPASAEIVDGRGLFAVPGLADLHAHFEPDDLPLFLANGITTVREMNGSEDALRLREEIRSGARPGPRLYVAGPLLAGVEQPWRHKLVRSADEGELEVRLEARAGYDFIKIYDGLTTEAYQAVVAAASDVGLPAVGHIPEPVGLASVIEHGQLTIEHVEQIVNATVGHDLDETRIEAIVRVIAGGSTAVTPTLAAMEILSARRTRWFDELFARPEMRYAPSSVIGWWESLRQPPEGRASLADAPPGGSSAWIEFARSLTRALDEAGVTILVGTDTPNPLLVPGFSLHHELEALARAGLEPSRLLRAATLGAAVHLGAGDEAGVIGPGRWADIALIGANPLEDLSHLRDVRGLVLRGTLYDRAALDTMLEEVAERRARP